MRTITLITALAMLLPSPAEASRFKGYASGGSTNSTGQNQFLAPSPYSRGGDAKTAFAFTTSPLWALVGLAKVKGEVRLLNRLSVALQAAGGYSVPHGGPTIGFGAQVSTYFSGNFDRGWSLGASLMQFGSMLAPETAVQSPSDRFEGIFLGWKSTAKSRAVLEIQLGAQRWLRSADSFRTGSDEVLPALGFNYGWAFSR
jgi:hypothetical protein